MKKKICFNVLILLGVMCIIGCKDEDKATVTATVPVLTSTVISNISVTTATSGGKIISDGGSTVIERGICWGKGQTPIISDNKTTDGSGVGDFSSSISGLDMGTTYFVRAYATNSAGTAYGNAVSFTTNVIDIDKNVYHTVTIGTQVWMVENLKTTHYRNGDALPNITDNTEWNNLSSGAYCNYNNAENIASTYGRLYNWFVVTDSRNICPLGWHIPSDDDWDLLINKLGGYYAAGGKMKETGTNHWTDPNRGADNSSGFSCLPAGFRSDYCGFSDIGGYCYFWSNQTSGSGRVLIYNGILVACNNNGPGGHKGQSIRCLKD